MNINDFLKKYKISCNKLAQKLDMHPNHIWMVANGKRNASLELAMKIEAISNGEVTVAEIRPPSTKRRCPCCGKVLALNAKINDA